MSRALVMCEQGGALEAPEGQYVWCTDATGVGYPITVQAAPVDLSVLSWSEVSVLMSALLGAVCLAAAWNLLSSFMGGRR